MLSEFDRGRQITDQIEQGKASWHDLFVPTDFFSRYRQYIQIVAVSGSEDNAKLWNGFIESKIRLFVSKLEQLMHVVASPPFPEGFQTTMQATDTAKVLDALIYREQQPAVDTPLGSLADTKPTEPQEEGKDPSPEVKAYHVCSFYIALELQSASGM